MIKLKKALCLLLAFVFLACATVGCTIEHSNTEPSTEQSIEPSGEDDTEPSIEPSAKPSEEGTEEYTEMSTQEKEVFMLRDFSKEKFDVFILAGQSNAEGYSYGPVEEPYEPNDNVFYLNPDFTVVQATEKVSGNEIQSNFSLSFAREYMKAGKLEEGRKILILRAAVGGTGFLDKNWGMEDELYLRMMDMIRTALELNRENRLTVLLWHQGESDVLKNASYEVHYTNLMNLLKSVRETFCVPTLPFIAGDFVPHWKSDNVEICTPVVDAIRAVCRDCQYGKFVESDSLKSNFEELNRETAGWVDYIHFSRRSIYILGVRYFEAFLEIVSDAE